MRKISFYHVKRLVVLLSVMAVAICLAPVAAQAEYPEKPISYN